MTETFANVINNLFYRKKRTKVTKTDHKIFMMRQNGSDNNNWVLKSPKQPEHT